MTCSTGWGEWCADCPLSVCCKDMLCLKKTIDGICPFYKEQGCVNVGPCHREKPGMVYREGATPHDTTD
jgi:hypothetical protein